MLNRFFSQKLNLTFKNFLHFFIISILMLTCLSVYAEGKDLLAGTESDLVSTIQGTGKKYLYIAEVVIASIGFVKTRNPSVFAGIIALAAGFNVLLKVAGV